MAVEEMQSNLLICRRNGEDHRGRARMLFVFPVLFAGLARTTIIPIDVALTREHLIPKLDLLKTGMEIGEMFGLLEQRGLREIVNAEENKEFCMALPS